MENCALSGSVFLDSAMICEVPLKSHLRKLAQPDQGLSGEVAQNTVFQKPCLCRTLLLLSTTYLNRNHSTAQIAVKRLASEQMNEHAYPVYFRKSGMQKHAFSSLLILTALQNERRGEAEGHD
jgi:hypothetical protein